MGIILLPFRDKKKGRSEVMGSYAQNKLLFLIRFLISDVDSPIVNGILFVTKFLGNEVMI